MYLSSALDRNNLIRFDMNTTIKGKYERAPTTPGSIPIGAPVSAATQFNRLGYGPSFMVNHRAIHNVDNLPPQRITDLTLEDYDAATKEIILTWSCPLDNFGFGKPGKSD